MDFSPAGFFCAGLEEDVFSLGRFGFAEKGYAAATGSKGFRWLESEMIQKLDKEDDIDRTYYNNLVDEAVKSISSYGDFEYFVSDEPFVSEDTTTWLDERAS